MADVLPFVARRFAAGDTIVTGFDTSVPALPVVLSVDQLAIVLDMTRMTATRLIDEGVLPSIRRGGRRFIVTADLLGLFYEAEERRLDRLADRKVTHLTPRSQAAPQQ